MLHNVAADLLVAAQYRSQCCCFNLVDGRARVPAGNERMQRREFAHHLRNHIVEFAAVRDAIVRRVLKEWLPAAPATPGFHTWLPLPAGRTLAALIAQAAQAGITLAPPGTLRRMENESLGVRLCLGAPATEAELERALIEIRRILEMAEAISFV